MPSVFSYGIGNVILHQVYEYKYLGILFTPSLKWDSHISSICSHALQKLGYVKRTLKSSTKKVEITAYKTLIRPILEHGCVV